MRLGGRKRRVAVVLVSAAVAVAAFSGWILWPRPPDLTLSPHKTAIQYVSFAEAHRKPIINVGSFKWPKGLEGVSPNDDPKITMGYLVMDVPSNVLIRLRSAFGEAEVDTEGVIRKEIVPIQFPASESERDCKLVVGEDRITVRRRFDPTATPARLSTFAWERGDCEVTARFFTGDTKGARICARVQVKRDCYYKFEAPLRGMSGSGPVDHTIELEGAWFADGSVRADLRVELSSEAALLSNMNAPEPDLLAEDIPIELKPKPTSALGRPEPNRRKMP
jgi:hypothetical protein